MSNVLPGKCGEITPERIIVIQITLLLSTVSQVKFFRAVTHKDGL